MGASASHVALICLYVLCECAKSVQLMEPHVDLADCIVLGHLCIT